MSCAGGGGVEASKARAFILLSCTLQPVTGCLWAFCFFAHLVLRSGDLNFCSRCQLFFMSVLVSSSPPGYLFASHLPMVRCAYFR